MKIKLGWLYTTGRLLYGGLLFFLILLIWFVSTPLFAAAHFMDWLDDRVDREFNRLFKGW